MNAEQTDIPSGTTEHVSVDDSGVIMLSEEAQAVMAGIEPPVVDDPPQESPPVEESPKNEARKIKWNGREVEVPADKEVELIQKGYNYEQQMQRLEDERAKLAAYSGLVQSIEASPDIRAKVAEALGYRKEQPQPEVPTFDDPIEQLKWETRQEVLKEVESRFVKPLQEQTRAQQYQQHLENVKQTVRQDPDFNDVQAAIVAQLKTMPEMIARDLYERLDKDTQAYMQMYETTKARLKAENKNSTKLTSQDDRPPEPIKRETKAPLLESGSNSVPDSSEQAKMRERIKELTKRSRNGDYRAAGELFELMA